MESDESNIATFKSDGIYVAVLDRTNPSPFAPHASASRVRVAGRRVSCKGKQIDLTGLMSRVVPIPIEPTNVRSIYAREDRLYYLTQPPSLIAGAFPGETSALHVFDFDSLSDAVLVKGLDSFSLSADGTSVLS